MTLVGISGELGDAFEQRIEELKSDSSLRAVILTGAGNAFSAGGDLEFLLNRTKSPAPFNVEEMLKFYNRFLCIRSLSIPTIASINGPAIGAGLCLAVACDLRIAAKDAVLSWSFATLGLHPGMAATHFTPQVGSLKGGTRSPRERVSRVAVEIIDDVNIIADAMFFVHAIA